MEGEESICDITKITKLLRYTIFRKQYLRYFMECIWELKKIAYSVYILMLVKIDKINNL